MNQWGSALLILDVIRCFYVLDLALSLASNGPSDDDGALVAATYAGGRLDPQKP